MLMRSMGALTAFALQASASVMAAGPTAVPDHPWTLRGDFTINTPSEPLPGDAVLAVSLARRLGRRWGGHAGAQGHSVRGETPRFQLLLADGVGGAHAPSSMTTCAAAE